MREVGAFEAKNKLGQLLDLVERGEEIVITRQLELAHRRSLPLASLDKELRAAGRPLGVPLLGAAA